MGARRCTLHGSFPDSYSYRHCPVCGEDTDYLSNDEPDENWERNVARMQEHLDTAALELPDIPVLTDVRVITRDDRLYIHGWDVYHAVRRRLRDGDLVQIGKQTFETLGYIEAERLYLVRAFSLTLTADELGELAGP